MKSEPLTNELLEKIYKDILSSVASPKNIGISSITNTYFTTKSPIIEPFINDVMFYIRSGTTIYPISSQLKNRWYSLPSQITDVSWHFKDINVHKLNHSMWDVINAGNTILRSTLPCYVEFEDMVIFDTMFIYGFVVDGYSIFTDQLVKYVPGIKTNQTKKK